LKRIVCGIIITLLLIGMLTFAFNIQPVKAGTITVPDDYPTIQEAIDAANPGDTIFVEAGTYFENVVINKALSLIGENRSTTIIDGNGAGDVIRIVSNNVSVRRSTIQNSSGEYPNSGIFLDNVEGCRISDNNVSHNHGHGIFLMWANNNNVSNNLISFNGEPGIRVDVSKNNLIGNYLCNNNVDGIFLYGAFDCLIQDNFAYHNTMSGIAITGGSTNITVKNNIAEENGGSGIFLCCCSNGSLIESNILQNNWCGIDVSIDSFYNTVIGNTVVDNDKGICLYSNSNQTIYHNNFIDNAEQAGIHESYENTWNNVYPFGGNYWSDQDRSPCADHYSGPEQDISGSDGIVDIPYVIDQDNQDHYPLMEYALGTSVPPNLMVFSPETTDLTVSVDGVVFPGTYIGRIHWNWGDGNSEDHWFPAFHTYADYGEYTITVRAYQSDGLTTTKTRQVSLSPLGIRPTILILINENLYPKIGSKLSIFEQDLYNEGYEVIENTVTEEATPPEIKNIIQSCSLQANLVGTFLIGNIKAAYSEIKTGWGSGPLHKIWISLDACDMYYMDLDGEWEHVANPDFCEDAPPNIEECYTYPSCETFKNEYIIYLDEEKEWNYWEIENKTQYKAEIWVSRIMANNLEIPGKNESQIINEFFDWNHNFRTGGCEVSSKAYLLAAWAESGLCPYQCMDYSTLFDTVVKMDNVTKEDFLTCLGDHEGSKLMYLGAHSWPQGHALYDTYVTTDDLVNKNKTSIFYILNACSSCRWDHCTSSPADPNYLGGLYVFDTSPDRRNYGLGVIGFTGVGGFNWLEYFTDYLNDHSDSNYGEAYKYWFNLNLMHIFGTNNYVFLGDPTIGPETPDLTPPKITVFEPENKIYENNDIPLTFTVNEKTPWIGYSVDGESNVTITGSTTLILSEGNHWIKVYANDTHGNMGCCNIVYFTVLEVIHDIAVTDATPQKTVVCQGYNLRINVTVANQGDLSETFNLTVYANETEIETKQITLESGSIENITFTWNTTGFEKYKNYTSSAYAHPVEGETDIADNEFIDNEILISIVGDIAGSEGFPDGKVDMRDIGTAAQAFGSYHGHLRWNPVADINNDSKVDMKDIGIVAKEFGRTV